MIKMQTKDAERIKKIREQNRKRAKTCYERRKQKMVKGTRYCRVCQKPETTVKFDDIFDPKHKTASNLYYLASIVVC